MRRDTPVRCTGTLWGTEDAAAVALCERGWLERRWHGDDVVFLFTDTGLAALDLNALRRTDPADLN